MLCRKASDSWVCAANAHTINYLQTPLYKNILQTPTQKTFWILPTTDIQSPLRIVPLRGFGGFQQTYNK